MSLITLISYLHGTFFDLTLIFFIVATAWWCYVEFVVLHESDWRESNEVDVDGGKVCIEDVSVA